MSKRDRLQAAGTAVAAASSSSNEHVESCLAEEIRHSILDQAYSQKRYKFINTQLRKMSEHELVRFEFFIRSHFQRPTVKRIVQEEVDRSLELTRIARRSWSGDGTRPPYAVPDAQIITDEMAIIVSGLGKLLVGELVSAAMEIQRERISVTDAALALASAAAGDAGSSSSSRARAMAKVCVSRKLTPELIEAAVLRLQREGKLGLGLDDADSHLFSRQGELSGNIGGKLPCLSSLDGNIDWSSGAGSDPSELFLFRSGGGGADAEAMSVDGTS